MTPGLCPSCHVTGGYLPMGVLERGGDGRVTWRRLFLGRSTRIRACLQAKLTEMSWNETEEKVVTVFYTQYTFFKRGSTEYIRKERVSIQM